MGGKVVEGKNLVVEAMRAAGLKVNPAEYAEAPATVTYEIRKMIFINRFCNRNCMWEKFLLMTGWEMYWMKTFAELSMDFLFDTSFLLPLLQFYYN